VPGPDAIHILLAYGPMPGMELIPYFLGLLAWAGLALGAIFVSPISALIRRLRRTKGAPHAEPTSEPATTSAPESPAVDDQLTV
jgi:hypothetical protein